MPKPGSAARPHLQHDTPDTPDIDLEIVSLLLCLDDFWRHPKDGALHSSMRTAVVVRPFRYSKVRYLTNTRCLDEDVVCLQVLASQYVNEGQAIGGRNLTRWRMPFECRYSKPLRI